MADSVDAAAGPQPQSNPVTAQLARAHSPSELDAEAIAIEAVDAAVSDDGAAEGRQSVAGIDVGVDRPDARLLETSIETPSKLGGTFNARDPRLLVGVLASHQVDAAPSFSPIASRIVRKPARAPLLLYAEDDIGLQAMFRLRQGDAKEDFLEAFGGNDATLAAVRRGLTWIERHQFEDGRWSLNKFNECCRGHGKCNGHGGVNSDAAATGFALLPFLGDGHTHQDGDFQDAVGRGLQYLVAGQKEDGELTTGKEGNARMYSHGIAAIALCEAYGMTKDEWLREPAQRAIRFIEKAQHKGTGGWRYQPNQPADTSVVGWQVMALKSAQMAGLDVSQSTLNGVKKWLDKVEGEGNKRGQYGYQNQNGKIAMTAEALLCREYLGVGRNDPTLHAGAAYMLKNLPQPNKHTSYYWYYGTQTMYHLQGDYWQQWNDALRDMLVASQRKSGAMAGTWDPKDQWEKSGGRIYATALRLLMLEVYYRHLPLYQVLED